jgi:hypothetical protein
MLEEIMTAKLSLGICSIIATGRGAGMCLGFLHRVFRMARENMAI